MTAVVQTPEDVVNAALVDIGHKERVGSLYDGSEAARLSLDIFGQVRDELLRRYAPDFAMRNVTMTLLKSAPAGGGYIPGPSPWNPAVNPPPGWLFEYSYPGDCLKVRCVKQAPLLFPNVDPSDNVYQIDNDNVFSPAQRVILCNVPSAILVYVGRVTDPTTMDVSFVDLFCDTLGKRLAPALTGLEAAKKAEADEAQGIAPVILEQG